MSTVIEVEALTTFDVTPGGERIRMHARDRDGKAATFSVPSESVMQLMMTLPRMARQALRARHGDDSLRVVYSMNGWTTEAAAGGETFILTLETKDGFEVAFALDEQACAHLAGALANAPARARAQLTAIIN